MKLSIEKGELLRGLGRIQSIVEKRNSMPILANVLLTTSEHDGAGTMAMAATDLEVGIRSHHKADIQEEGGVTVSAKKFYEITRELADERVELELTSNAYLKIVCARSRFTLAATAAEEYPTLPSFSPERVVTVHAALMSLMIDRTMYAASVDETRYNLNGVYLEVLSEEGKIRMVATDGHRLALIDRALGESVKGLASGVIIPRKGLSELKRLLDEEDADEVQLAFEGNSGLAKKGGVTLVMRLIEGEFPNYNQVIPNRLDRHVILPIDGLQQALRRVILLSSERSRAVKFELGEGRLIVSSSNPDLGDAREEIDIDYAGEALEIGFNARYLMDALASIHAKEAKLSFQDALSPAQITPTDDDDALAVVMPMRI